MNRRNQISFADLFASTNSNSSQDSRFKKHQSIDSSQGFSQSQYQSSQLEFFDSQSTHNASQIYECTPKKFPKMPFTVPSGKSLEHSQMVARKNSVEKCNNPSQTLKLKIKELENSENVDMLLHRMNALSAEVREMNTLLNQLNNKNNTQSLDDISTNFSNSVKERLDQKYGELYKFVEDKLSKKTHEKDLALEMKKLTELTSERNTSFLLNVSERMEKGGEGMETSLSQYAKELTELLRTFNKMSVERQSQMLHEVKECIEETCNKHLQNKKPLMLESRGTQVDIAREEEEEKEEEKEEDSNSQHTISYPPSPELSSINQLINNNPSNHHPFINNNPSNHHPFIMDPSLEYSVNTDASNSNNNYNDKNHYNNNNNCNIDNIIINNDEATMHASSTINVSMDDSSTHSLSIINPSITQSSFFHLMTTHSSFFIHPSDVHPLSTHSSISHPSISHQSIPPESIPHLSIPSQSIPYQSIPHPFIPDPSISHQPIPPEFIPHSSIPLQSISPESISHPSIPHVSVLHSLTTNPSTTSVSLSHQSSADLNTTKHIVNNGETCRPPIPQTSTPQTSLSTLPSRLSSFDHPIHLHNNNNHNNNNVYKNNNNVYSNSNYNVRNNNINKNNINNNNKNNINNNNKNNINNNNNNNINNNTNKNTNNQTYCQMNTRCFDVQDNIYNDQHGEPIHNNNSNNNIKSFYNNNNNNNTNNFNNNNNIKNNLSDLRNNYSIPRYIDSLLNSQNNNINKNNNNNNNNNINQNITKNNNDNITGHNTYNLSYPHRRNNDISNVKSIRGNDDDSKEGFHNHPPLHAYNNYISAEGANNVDAYHLPVADTSLDNLALNLSNKEIGKNERIIKESLSQSTYEDSMPFDFSMDRLSLGEHPGGREKNLKGKKKVKFSQDRFNEVEEVGISEGVEYADDFVPLDALDLLIGSCALRHERQPLRHSPYNKSHNNHSNFESRIRNNGDEVNQVKAHCGGVQTALEYSVKETRNRVVYWGESGKTFKGSCQTIYQLEASPSLLEAENTDIRILKSERSGALKNQAGLKNIKSSRGENPTHKKIQKINSSCSSKKTNKTKKWDRRRKRSNRDQAYEIEDDEDEIIHMYDSDKENVDSNSTCRYDFRKNTNYKKESLDIEEDCSSLSNSTASSGASVTKLFTVLDL